MSFFPKQTDFTATTSGKDLWTYTSTATSSSSTATTTYSREPPKVQRFVLPSSQVAPIDQPSPSKSKSIPVPVLHRTASEIQLSEEEALAEYRDQLLFTRVTEHMARSQDAITDEKLRQTNSAFLASIWRNHQCASHFPVSQPNIRRPPESEYDDDMFVVDF